MTAPIIVLALVILAALAYLTSLKGGYEVRRSLVMDIPADRAYDEVRDYRNWPHWSPWLIHEPDAKLTFSDEPDKAAGWYEWNGKYVGAGKITHEQLDAAKRIVDRIEFVRPFKSVSTVGFEFRETAGGTEVTWTMAGTMPFFLRFMVPMMTGMIARDYDLGLALLRGRLDPSAERPIIRFNGFAERNAETVLTRSFKGNLEAVKQVMNSGFPQLVEHVAQTGGQPLGAPFTAYYKSNPRTLYFEGDMAIPVGTDTPDGEFTRKTLGDGKYYRVHLQGSYEFLGLAWNAAFSHLRMYKIKVDRSRPTLEVYENDPRSVDNSNEIKTSLYIPIR
ncbi:MAG: SRPBCC family protein [Chromatiales bacterium]|nr:SRPBCC family protein [Chromatiales bacterium]